MIITTEYTLSIRMISILIGKNHEYNHHYLVVHPTDRKWVKKQT